jgi:uncharacterized membrane protein required for colicin V production
MNNWNGLDFFIFLIFLVNTLLGMSRGATREIISMICLSAALIFTIKFTVPVARFLNSSPLIANVLSSSFIQNFMVSIGAQPLTASMLSELAYTISLLICFVGTFGVCEATLAFTGFVEVFPFSYAALNRKIGAGLGAMRGYVLNLILILILTLHITVPALTKGSFFVNLFQSSVIQLDSLISGQEVERYREIFKEKNLYNVKDILAPVTSPTELDKQP